MEPQSTKDKLKQNVLQMQHKLADLLSAMEEMEDTAAKPQEEEEPTNFVVHLESDAKPGRAESSHVDDDRVLIYFNCK